MCFCFSSSCPQCCQCLWIAHAWLPLQFLSNVYLLIMNRCKLYFMWEKRGRHEWPVRRASCVIDTPSTTSERTFSWSCTSQHMIWLLIWHLNQSIVTSAYINVYIFLLFIVHGMHIHLPDRKRRTNSFKKKYLHAHYHIRMVAFFSNNMTTWQPEQL